MSNDATDPAETAQRRAGWGWMKIALLVSLALNLLFAGLVVGGAWHHRPGKWTSKNQALEMTIEQMIAELPADKRPAGAAALRRLRDEVAPISRGLRDARKEAIAALKADPYDHQRFSSSMAKLRDIRSRSRAGRHQVVLDLVEDMTVAQRQRFLELFRSNLRAGKGRKRKHDGS